jgi:glycosyltransferase involved in cell wall biosynthesis
MRILFVGMPESIHTARWLSQINGEGWDIYLFPSIRTELHPDIKNINILSPIFQYSYRKGQGLNRIQWVAFLSFIDKHMTRILRRPFTYFSDRSLAWVIQKLKPDIVQSLEIQHAGYLTLKSQAYLKDHFPTWIATNWGSDIYLFGRFPEHQEKIKSVLAHCDYYSGECHRDIDLAYKFGFTGKVLPVLPNAGGYELERIAHLRQEEPVSGRRIILLKGYQHWAGRALVGLRALARSANIMEGYQVAIYAANSDVQIAARLFAQDTHIPVEIIPPCSHEELLRWYGKARIYIGLSISDAISTSLLEAIVMGAFPIQSDRSCANEWIQHGKNGFIVPPEDPDIIAEAIKEAILNDDLVDQASAINAVVSRDRLDASKLKPQVIKMYQDIVAERRK